jgi:hypothetical protein
MNNERKFLTPAELVQRWNNAVSVGTLANWRNKKRGPGYQKVGSRVLYPLEKVVAWEASNAVAMNDNETVSGALNG